MDPHEQCKRYKMAQGVTSFRHGEFTGKLWPFRVEPSSSCGLGRLAHHGNDGYGRLHHPEGHGAKVPENYSSIATKRRVGTSFVRQALLLKVLRGVRSNLAPCGLGRHCHWHCLGNGRRSAFGTHKHSDE